MKIPRHLFAGINNLPLIELLIAQLTTGRKILQLTTLCLIFIILMEFIFKRAWPGWTFSSRILVYLNEIITYFAFFGLIVCTIFLVKAPRVLGIVFSMIIFLIFCVASCATIFPMGANPHPTDFQVIQSLPDGKKVLVREIKNPKINITSYDTVIVKDLLIFRRIYK